MTDEDEIRRKQGDERKGLIKKKTYDVNEMDLNEV